MPADYGTPIRNSIVLMMSGPAVEIAALDSRIPSRCRQKRNRSSATTFVSGVTVKHASSGGFASS